MGAMTSSIAAKFAFFPPTPPSYTVTKDPATGRLRFNEIPLQDNVEIMFLQTARKQEIVAMFVRNPRAPHAPGLARERSGPGADARPLRGAQQHAAGQPHGVRLHLRLPLTLRPSDPAARPALMLERRQLSGSCQEGPVGAAF